MALWDVLTDEIKSGIFCTAYPPSLCLACLIPVGFLCYWRKNMKYTKPALSYDEQAASILKCGLESNRAELVECLERVSYYRLSGYVRPFQNSYGKYLPCTTLNSVWRRHTFDRMLRLMLLDAIERVEVTIRTRLVYHLSQVDGPFRYTDPAN